MRPAALLLFATATFATLGASCARETNAQVATADRITPDDTASVTRLLGAVRGVDPFLCELATRNVDMHGWWSRYGPLAASSPLETDSVAAAMIVWIQRRHNDPAFVPRLHKAMRDSDACVRRVAGSFLARVDHPSALQALLAGLDDASAETRVVAALGLGLAEKPGTVEPLLRRLRDDSPAVRRAAAWALGSLEDHTAVQPLIELLQRDSDPRVRQAAAWAIGNIHG